MDLGQCSPKGISHRGLSYICLKHVKSIMMCSCWHQMYTSIFPLFKNIFAVTWELCAVENGLQTEQIMTLCPLSCTHKSNRANGRRNVIVSWHLPFCTFAEVRLIILLECLMFTTHVFKGDRSPFHKPNVEVSFTTFFCVCVCVCVCVCSVLPTGCLSACGGDRLEGEGVNTEKLEKEKDNVRGLKCSKNRLIYFSPGGIYLCEFPNECESLVWDNEEMIARKWEMS